MPKRKEHVGKFRRFILRVLVGCAAERGDDWQTALASIAPHVDATNLPVAVTRELEAAFAAGQRQRERELRRAAQ
jgi:hypothetical protein